MKKISVFFLSLLASQTCLAMDLVKTNKIDKYIQFIDMSYDDLGRTMRTASFTFQSLDTCKILFVSGSVMSKDDIKIADIILANEVRVKKGQKFKTSDVFPKEEGQYILIDHVRCD